MKLIRNLGAAAVALGCGAALAGPVLAAPATHAGEMSTVSKTTGLTDGETVTVNFSGYTPGGNPVTVVIAGQGEFDGLPTELDFTKYAEAPKITVGADGTGTTQFQVYQDAGVATQGDGQPMICGVNGQRCWIVAVQEPFLPQPNYSTNEITFGGPTPPPPTEAPVTQPPVTEAPTTVAETTTTTIAETTTTIEATTTTTPDTGVTVEDTDDGSNTPLIVAGVIAGLAIIGGLAAFLMKRSQGDGAVPPGGPATGGPMGPGPGPGGPTPPGQLPPLPPMPPGAPGAGPGGPPMPPPGPPQAPPMPPSGPPPGPPPAPPMPPTQANPIVPPPAPPMPPPGPPQAPPMPPSGPPPGPPPAPPMPPTQANPIVPPPAPPQPPPPPG